MAETKICEMLYEFGDANIGYKIIERYRALRTCKVHPSGEFDRYGRFYLADTYACCRGIRPPSHSYPYSQLRHGRSLEHVATDILQRKPTDAELSILRKLSRKSDVVLNDKLVKVMIAS